MSDKIRVTIWNEFRHEKTEEEAKAIYPNGIHGTIGEFLSKESDIEVRLAALDDPDQGFPGDTLENTDVLLWWGHMHHGEVDDALVERIRRRVYVGGMGFIALHSAHHSKPFRAIVGTTGNLLWGDNQKEIIWNIMPLHPIAAGVPQHFILPEEELYAEPFQIPQPDAHIFEGWFEHGYVFRTGVTYLRGEGTYTGSERQILLCAMHRRNVPGAKEIVLKEDPQAFMIVTAANQVLGKGFKPLDEEDL